MNINPIKIVVIGAPGVGKSSIINRFLQGKFDPIHTATTQKYSYYTSMIVNEGIYHLKINDIPSIPYFPKDTLDEWSRFQHYGLLSADAYLLVFDINALETFNYVRHIREQLIHVRNEIQLIHSNYARSAVAFSDSTSIPNTNTVNSDQHNIVEKLKNQKIPTLGFTLQSISLGDRKHKGKNNFICPMDSKNRNKFSNINSWDIAKKLANLNDSPLKLLSPVSKRKNTNISYDHDSNELSMEPLIVKNKNKKNDITNFYQINEAISSPVAKKGVAFTSNSNFAYTHMGRNPSISSQTVNAPFFETSLNPNFAIIFIGNKADLLDGHEDYNFMSTKSQYQHLKSPSGTPAIKPIRGFRIRRNRRFAGFRIKRMKKDKGYQSVAAGLSELKALNLTEFSPRLPNSTPNFKVNETHLKQLHYKDNTPLNYYNVKQRKAARKAAAHLIRKTWKEPYIEGCSAKKDWNITAIFAETLRSVIKCLHANNLNTLTTTPTPNTYPSTAITNVSNDNINDDLFGELNNASSNLLLNTASLSNCLIPLSGKHANGKHIPNATSFRRLTNTVKNTSLKLIFGAKDGFTYGGFIRR